MSNKELSNCCKAPVKVDSADEGTSCYMCSKCSKPCDLFVSNKEQVSVDSAGAYFSLEQINLMRQWFNSLEDVHPTYLKGQDYKLYGKIQNLLGNKLRRCHQEIVEEYERLKRLDENVKKIKERLEQGKLKSGKVKFNHVKLYVEDLESLYDE